MQIIIKLKTLVQKEKQLSAQIVRELQKVADQKLHLKMGYDSLFSFCVKELGMSEANTSRKLRVIRVANTVPEVLEKIENGDLSEAKVVQVGAFMANERKQTKKEMGKRETRALLKKVTEAPNHYETQKLLANESTAPDPVREKVKAHSGGKQSITIEADDELIELLEGLRTLHSHKNLSRGELIKRTIREHLIKNHPAYKKSKNPKKQEPLLSIPNKNSQQTFTESNNASSTRYVSQKTKSVVWKRDRGQCTYKNCSSTFRLQIDHIKPYAKGGSNDPDNLRLLCANHNLLEAERHGLLKRRQPTNST